MSEPTSVSPITTETKRLNVSLYDRNIIIDKIQSQDWNFVSSATDKFDIGRVILVFERQIPYTQTPPIPKPGCCIM